MKKRLVKKTFIISSLLFLFSSGIICAESFRVHKTIISNLDIKTEQTTVQLGINDALAVFLPSDKTYLQGFSLEVKIPPLVASWQDSMAWTLFDNISPTPTSNTIDYSGSSISFGILPPRLTWSVIIPTTKENTIKNNPYISKLDVVANENSTVVFIRLQQAMKGTPEEFEDAIFDITIKPILFNKGRLLLDLNNSSNEVRPCSIFLDEKPFEPSTEGNYIETGIHTISLVSEFYRNEVRTVHIEQAKDTQLSINLRSIEPTVVFTAPTNATVYFDNQTIENKENELIITEGEHFVKFILGDYEVVKTFTAIKGQSYNVSLNVEAIVSESE